MFLDFIILLLTKLDSIKDPFNDINHILKVLFADINISKRR